MSATTTNPFSAVEDADDEAAAMAAEAAADEVEETEGPRPLAEAAQTALTSDVDGQPTFDGMHDENLTKVRFVGMGSDFLDEKINLGEERTFVVRARCVGVGEEEMQDGHVRHIVKMKQESVVIKD